MPWLASLPVSSVPASSGFYSIFGLRAIAYSQAGTGVGLDAILRNRIAQAVARKPLPPPDHLGQESRRDRHQQLVVEHAAVTAFRVAGDRQARFAGRKRPAPGIAAPRFGPPPPSEPL